jgi:hypothetical protein
VKHTSYKAPNYAVFSSLLTLPPLINLAVLPCILAILQAQITNSRQVCSRAHTTHHTFIKHEVKIFFLSLTETDAFRTVAITQKELKGLKGRGMKGQKDVREERMWSTQVR